MTATRDLKLLALILTIYFTYSECYNWGESPPGPKHGLKYILDWHPTLPFDVRGPDGEEHLSAQKLFFKKKCPVYNCYLTSDREYFLGNLSNFAAIIFNLPQLYKLNRYAFPAKKYPDQKFIYFGTESAENYPVCTKDFDNYFDWTFTYRLDSDVVFRHFTVRDKEGQIVAPQLNPRWKKRMSKIDLGTMNKTSAAVWYPKECFSKSKRSTHISELDQALSEYGYAVDVVGKCGDTDECVLGTRAECYSKLSEQYYFFLAYESSVVVDYVTSIAVNVNYADNMFMVPIVYGGANYSNFLPPGSYIDARKYSPELLALKMVQLMKSPSHYSRFFKWKKYYNLYTRESGLGGHEDGMCDLCRLLNDRYKVRRRQLYQDFRKWWYPYYKDECKRIVKQS